MFLIWPEGPAVAIYRTAATDQQEAEVVVPAQELSVVTQGGAGVMNESNVQNMSLARLGIEEVEERLEVSPLLYADEAADREFAQTAVCSCDINKIFRLIEAIHDIYYPENDTGLVTPSIWDRIWR